MQRSIEAEKPLLGHFRTLMPTLRHRLMNSSLYISLSLSLSLSLAVIQIMPPMEEKNFNYNVKNYCLKLIPWTHQVHFALCNLRGRRLTSVKFQSCKEQLHLCLGDEMRKNICLSLSLDSSSLE